MLDTGKKLLLRRPIAGQLVGDDHARDVLKYFEKLAKKSLRSLFVASALNQDVQHVAMLIDGSPQRVLLASNGKHHLVHMPCVATARTALA